LTEVKFCGNRTERDIAFVNEARPDYAGFIMTPGFGRSVGAGTVEKLASEVDGSILRVGVFVDDDPERIADVLNEGTIDIAQLHGSESEEYIARLRGLTDGLIIKCFRPMTQQDVSEALKTNADIIMFDAGKGSGRTFDWSVLRDADREYFLAGGLTADNVGEAVRRLRPFAVDTSSGTETDGKKDLEKMKRFMAAVEEADAEIDDQ
jgi:phosphoribosylanthranilate isomerase